ncbi:MAG: lipopolysaccharide biosynthesis protein [Bacteroidetes bacterium]|jgi:O-antigen/teichoic acid export membrane protein|nr:lipopolysaccharide biosynthesis protein [Bacteroidota bacterium]MBT6685648.1 lipopolysaccharide biosynthesis protein [Bacteroidota bacterium]MBT7141872.1 lipopolysaccharide biosynthesis protein [Bacteroidota bacterium]MBT7491051.1 lipopolysaccharide biosynthesis protein [Bacteroidota bacterium]
MQDFIKKHFGNEFVKNVLTLFSGSFLAQLIPLLILPVLTRLYSTEVFAIFFIYSSIVMVLSVLSTLQMELAIVLPSNRKDAVNVLILSIIISIVVSLVLLVIIIFFSKEISILIGEKGIENWLFFVPISIFFLGIFQSFNYWCNRVKDYKSISYTKVCKSVSAASSQVSAGLMPTNNFGMIGGMLIGQFFSASFITFRVLKNERNLLADVSFSDMLSLAKKYRDIPKLNTLIGLLNNLSNHLPIFLLTKFFGSHITPHFGMAQRIVGTPMGMLSQSIGQVFYQQASDIYNRDGDLFAFIKKAYINLLKISIVPFGIAMIFAPILFNLFLGEGWEISGQFAQILVPWLFVMFLNSPITFVITILNKQKQMLVYDIFLIIFRFLALFCGYFYFDSFFVSIILFSLVGLGFNVFLMFYLFKISKSVNNDS